MNKQEKNKKLNILMMHNSYQYAGGEDVSTQSEIDILRRFEHQVSYLQAHNNVIKNYSFQDKARLFFKTGWNGEAYHLLKSTMAEKRTDLLHVQNFFPLFSPSVHAAARSIQVPTVQHLRNFRLGCLNASLYRNNQICEDCIGKNPWRGIIRRCYKKSLFGSLAVWNMVSFNRLIGTWNKQVNAFITPSFFAANKLIEIGINPDLIHVKPNITNDPLTENQLSPLPQVPTFLYVGRLSSEKGVLTLLKAWQSLNQPQWKLNILGDGDQRKMLEEFVSEKQVKNVSFLGHQPKDIVTATIKASTAVLVPSQWYETFGRVVIEAFACGRTVIAADLGALPELVQDEINGFLVNANDVNSWKEYIDCLGNNPIKVLEISQQARETYLQKYTPEMNYKILMEIYNKIL